MKIYLVYRTDDISYDEYDSWVVIANNPKEAKALCKWYVDDPIVKTREIKPGNKAKTILGSFNEGSYLREQQIMKKIEILKIKQGYEVNISFEDGSTSSQWANTLETALLLAYDEQEHIEGLFQVQVLADEDQLEMSKQVRSAFKEVGRLAKYFVENFYKKSMTDK